MSQKPISLSFHYFGKTITVKNDSSVLEVRELFEMFKGIIITSFGEKQWEQSILNMGDEIFQNVDISELKQLGNQV